MLATVLQIISMNLLIIEYCIKIVYSKTLIIGSTLTIFTFLKYVNKKNNFASYYTYSSNIKIQIKEKSR